MTTTIATYQKDTNDILDYTMDWSAWLGSDTISTSSWTVPTGLTSVTTSNTTTSTTVWLSGGTTGVAYTVTNQIVTSGGRTVEKSFLLVIVDF